jgi:hypothetical protein
MIRDKELQIIADRKNKNQILEKNGKKKKITHDKTRSTASQKKRIA